MSVETAHGSTHANQSVARSSKQMIEVAPKGTTGEIRTKWHNLFEKQVAIPVKYQKQLVNSL